jgi:hypothetical protein
LGNNDVFRLRCQCQMHGWPRGIQVNFVAKMAEIRIIQFNIKIILSLLITAEIAKPLVKLQ